MPYKDPADKKAWAVNNRSRQKIYDSRSRRKNPLNGVCSLDVGAAAEHFVLAEMLSRGLTVTSPVNQQGPDDCFVRIGRWYTIQVKSATVSAKTGAIRLTNASRVTSDLIAMVDLPGRRIRWVSNTDGPVPPELL